MALVTPTGSSHWYTQTCDPSYGSTLREARKEHLLPSITSIIKIVNNEGLEAWKQEQLLMAALTLPKEPSELESDWIARVVNDGRSAGIQAADHGTIAHDAAEKFLKGEHIDYSAIPDGAFGYTEAFISWCRQCVALPHYMESVVVSLNHGYGGRIDLIADLIDGRTALVDFKTQSKPKGKSRKYDSWAWQLAAQRRAAKETMGARIDVCMNIIGHPDGQYTVVEYDNDDMADADGTFILALELWRKIKGFAYVRTVNV